MNINWSNVKDLTLDGKALKKLELDGQVVWEAKPKFYEWIRTNYTDYINTGIDGHMNYKYELIYQRVTTDLKRVWGACGNSNYIGYNMSITWTSGNYECIRWESSSSGSRIVNMIPLNTNKQTVVIDDGKVYINGTYKGISSGHNSSTVINYPLYLGTINFKNDSSLVADIVDAKFYSYKVWDNQGNLIQELKPCKYNNIVGMWDTVSNTFIPSATGTLTVGNDG